MFTALIFIIILGVLVLVHELGHFVMAKRAGMKVEEFGFGFPPRLFGIKRGETIYSINLIPFGGFVKIFGEDGGEKDSNRSFSSKSTAARAKVIVAGVVMNVLLAFVLLSIGNMWGLRVGFADQPSDGHVQDLRVQIIQVVSDSPAAQAELEMLDEVVGFRVDGKEINITSVKEVQNVIGQNKGKPIVFKIKRGSEVIEKEIVPRTDPPPGEGAVGISMALTGVVKYSWYESIWQGAKQTVILTANTFIGYGQVIKNAFTTGSAGAELSGPIGIAKFTGQAARIGFIYLLQLMALLSINLAVLNIMPFPALDGGRLLFLIIEKIKGSPMPKKAEALANSIGFSLLILLMIYVTTKDILKFL
ncbi:MAG: RIP metalloprotease RseP [bacterium]|nr:RIP metalloprotease RseP [bacterium]